MNKTKSLTEYFSGQTRPRHERFSKALKKLCEINNIFLNINRSNKVDKIIRKIKTQFSGIRSIKDTYINDPMILHHLLLESEKNYICEWDVPLSLYEYSLQRHFSKSEKVKTLLNKENLKKIILFSEWSKNSFLLHFGDNLKSKIDVIYPLSFENINKKANKEKNILYDFCFISSGFCIKGGPQLFKAFKRLKEEYKSISICFVTNLKEARQEIGTLPSKAEGFTWKENNLNDLQLSELLSNTSSLVHPSLLDSFGVVVLEAISLGCPIITTNIASFPEMVIDKYNGFLIDTKFSGVNSDFFIQEYSNIKYMKKIIKSLDLSFLENNLYETMKSITQNPDLLYRMKKNSLKIYQDKFSYKIWNKKMLNIILTSYPELRD